MHFVLIKDVTPLQEKPEGIGMKKIGKMLRQIKGGALEGRRMEIPAKERAVKPLGSMYSGSMHADGALLANICSVWAKTWQLSPFSLTAKCELCFGSFPK
jgi:hypothetical protein